MTDDVLRAQIVKLIEYIERIKNELAAIKHPDATEDHFHRVGDQLKAIVQATEAATHSIMDAAEQVQAYADKNLQGTPGHGEISDQIGRIFEACSFQDITGQRISNIVATMKLVETTIDSLAKTVGAADSSGQGLRPTDVFKKDDGVALAGPQLHSGGIKQDDIDKMFD
jgi:chemotaxis protein CheZ